jgi:hypothetical protein
MFLASCGKSSDQLEREAAVREAALQRALADSIVEEREKDRRMRDAAAEQANDRLASEAASHELEVANALQAPATPEQKQAERIDALRKYTDKLVQSMRDPGAVQVRKMELSPKQNGMCAEINAKPAGSPGEFKRVVVTDASVSIEEPPVRDTLNEFLLFQIAARDTGCFPDVEKLRILK